MTDNIKGQIEALEWAMHPDRHFNLSHTVRDNFYGRIAVLRSLPPNSGIDPIPVWCIVEKKSCFVIQCGNEVIASLAGPKARQHAETIKSILTAEKQVLPASELALYGLPDVMMKPDADFTVEDVGLLKDMCAAARAVLPKQDSREGTPRLDEFLRKHDGWTYRPMSLDAMDFARQLECDLTAAQSEAAALRARVAELEKPFEPPAYWPTDTAPGKYKPQKGIWTLVAPDGRTWEADTPLKTVSMESKDRVPATVALARIAKGIKGEPC
jgi:hypothetical protein